MMFLGRLNNKFVLILFRKSLTLAHQCQITQLKDTFKEKLRNVEDWPEKLNAELQKEREKHNHEIKKLEADLNTNFRMVLNFH